MRDARHIACRGSAHAEARERRRAFSLIELMVVLVVVGVLLTIIIGAAGWALESQRKANTQAIMQNVESALDQFATTNPLRLTYDGQNKTFGPYPPYQVAGSITANDSVAKLLDSQRPGTSAGQTGQQNGTFKHRLARDIGWGTGSANNWVNLDDGNGAQRANDDNRALAAYLLAFAPDAFNRIPANALKPLNPAVTDEWFDPSGNVTASGENRAAKQILGIHDGWGVPLDYMLYVRMEYGPGGVRITERVPALRSRGIKREIYDARVAGSGGSSDATLTAKWIFSRPLPAPYANVDTAGVFQTGGSSPQTNNGWVRAVAEARGTGPTGFGGREDYGYVPDQDPK